MDVPVQVEEFWDDYGWLIKIIAGATVVYVVIKLITKAMKRVVFKMLHGSKMKKYENVPGPTPVFPSGSISKLVNDDDMPWLSATKLSAEYNSGIVLIWIFGSPAFLINDCQMLDEVLAEKDIKCYYKDVGHLHPMLGTNDPFCANDEEYYKLRELHPFIRDTWREEWLPSQTDSIRKLAYQHLRFMATATKKKPVKLMWLCQKMMFDTFATSLVGTTLGDDAHDDYHYIGKVGQSRIESPIAAKFPPWSPKYYWVMKRWYARFQKLIDEGYANPDPSKTDIINFLQKSRADKKYSPDEVGETMHGGVYSVGSSIVSVLHCLSHDAATLARLRAELNEKLGDNPTGYSHETLQSCTFLECVMREGIRLLPPVAFYSRKASKDGATVNGVELSKGDTVMISTWLTMHDPEFWTEPYKFQPDRWLVTDSFLEENGYGSTHFCPFGKGLRQCMGYPYGLLNIKICVAAFVMFSEFYTDASTWKDNFFFGINMPYKLRAKVYLKEDCPSLE